MSEYTSPIGTSWEELRLELMTPEELAESDANVKALGELLDALDAGTITQAEFDAAFDSLNQPAQSAAGRVSA